jgi:hypothetical protein
MVVIKVKNFSIFMVVIKVKKISIFMVLTKVILGLCFFLVLNYKIIKKKFLRKLGLAEARVTLGKPEMFRVICSEPQCRKQICILA